MAAVGIEDVRRALRAHTPLRVPEPVRSRAAVAVVLREAAAGLEALFIHRAEHPDDPWSGHVGLPGGRAEAGDRDLVATAVRETAEELAIDLARSAELLGALDELRAMARGRPVDLAISPFVFHLREAVAARPNQEVRDAHWIPLAVLLGPEWRSTLHYDRDGLSLDLPCIRYAGLVIWGLTFRMLAGLEALLVGPAEATEPLGSGEPAR